MTDPDSPHVAGLYRYPVKGLSPQPLASAELVPGRTLPFDRAYAIEAGSGRFDPAEPGHLPKINFLMLMRDARLAALRTGFDAATRVLTVYRDGAQVARGDLGTDVGRHLLEQFFAGYMGADLRGPPRIVHVDGHSFSDRPEKCLHLINLATLRSLERSFGRPLDPLRFRANIYFDSTAPWQEFDWVDGEIGIGAARLRVFARTGRCEATNVDPATGRRDMAIPATLTRTFGHHQLGIYAQVLEGAVIQPGDPVGP